MFFNTLIISDPSQDDELKQMKDALLVKKRKAKFDAEKKQKLRKLSKDVRNFKIPNCIIMWCVL